MQAQRRRISKAMERYSKRQSDGGGEEEGALLRINSCVDRDWSFPFSTVESILKKLLLDRNEAEIVRR